MFLVEEKAGKPFHEFGDCDTRLCSSEVMAEWPLEPAILLGGR